MGHKDTNITQDRQGDATVDVCVVKRVTHTRVFYKQQQPDTPQEEAKATHRRERKLNARTLCFH